MNTFPSALNDRGRLFHIWEIRNNHTPMVHNGHISDRKLSTLFECVDCVIKLCQDDSEDLNYLSILEGHLTNAIVNKHQKSKVPKVILLSCRGFYYDREINLFLIFYSFQFLTSRLYIYRPKRMRSEIDSIVKLNV